MKKKLPVVNYTLTHTQRKKNKKFGCELSGVSGYIIQLELLREYIRRPHVSHDTGLALYPM
jgi:hypothetical protein